MTLPERIKDVLENSYELTRGEIVKKLGVTREQARKPLTKLLEAKEIERRTEDGIEWFTIAKKEKRSVEDSLGRQVEEGLREIEDFSMERWGRGYKAGYEEAWQDVGRAITLQLRKLLELEKEHD